MKPREMLQMQERMFKSFFDSIVTNVNTCLDYLTHKLAELKARIATSENETGDLRVLAKGHRRLETFIT